MASFHIEGVQKRLELSFSTVDLRTKLTRETLERILDPVECRIERVLSDDKVDAYLLSASSLFVFDDLVIIKTCGATKIFQCIQGIFLVAKKEMKSLLYSRGAFFRPEAQPMPHQSFSDEVEQLAGFLKDSGIRNTEFKILGNESKWHVVNGYTSPDTNNTKMCIELCMRELDRDKASVFYKKSEEDNMTNDSGIGKIFPMAKLDAFEFQPCGYSMNSVEGDAISTIHVSPEEVGSFASFESFRYDLASEKKLSDVIANVLNCFKPGHFSLAVYPSVAMPFLDLSFDGYEGTGREMWSAGSGCSVMYYTFRLLLVS